MAMPHLLPTLKKTFITGFTALLFIFPASSIASADEPCTPPPVTQSGVHWPVGADAGTFTYQCDGQYQGDWTNAHYIYYPDTNSRVPIDTPVYTYNQSTGLWDTTQWDYSPAQGNYVADTVSVNTPPAGAITIGGPTPVTTPSGGGTAGASNTNQLTTNQPSGTGINLDGSSNTAINNTTGATMNNGITSLATTGNALVGSNTVGGSATSGTATSAASVINMLQSSSNFLSDPNMLTFTANINGDVNGDLLLDPTYLGTVQPANTTANLNNTVTVNNSTDASINNNINLGATSGNADVSKNTEAGDATSGNANAVANIVNVLNSAVNAGQSFVGVININGNLNGDILLPPNFVDTLLASNVPHYNVTTANLNTTNNLTNTNNQSINNTINAGATSGNATVASNTEAGNATSGSAKTNLTVFNLTGSTVVASNDIMVFVNVLGSWYGMILNAPAGTTAASLGGGVTTNATATNDATLTNTNNQSINNNIDVNSKTGNATVSGNTHAGNATSGDATSSVILSNMINDSLSLNGWFGLLFINVFGTWTGSFGINTPAGDPVTPSDSNSSDNSGSGDASPTFQFVPKATTFSNKVYLSNGTTANTSGDASSSGLAKASVLAAQTVKSPASSLPQLAQAGQTNYLLPIVGIGLAIILLLAGERNRFLHRS